jgi:hypothetical protein
LVLQFQYHIYSMKNDTTVFATLSLSMLWIIGTIKQIIPNHLNPIWWIHFSIRETAILFEVILDNLKFWKQPEVHYGYLFDHDIEQFEWPDINYNLIIKQHIKFLASDDINRALFDLFTVIYWGDVASDKEYSFFLNLLNNLASFSVFDFIAYRWNLETIYNLLEEHSLHVRENVRKNTIMYQLSDKFSDKEIANITYHHFHDICLNWKKSIKSIIDNDTEFEKSKLTDIFLAELKEYCEKTNSNIVEQDTLDIVGFRKRQKSLSIKKT